MRELVITLAISTVLWAADPPPPEPSSTSIVGDTVTNPVTGLTTVVSELVVDPAGTATAGTTAFVKTVDGYVFLVKLTVGAVLYNDDDPPVAFTIVSYDSTAHTVELSVDGGPTASLSTRLTESDFDQHFAGGETPGEETPPIIESGASGVKNVKTGKGGSNGRPGALFVPPTSGGNGAIGPDVTVDNTQHIGPTNQIGIEAGSIGGKGGNGGNSYLSFWSGRDGGDGGAGGTVHVTNRAGIQVATVGNDHHGIFAYSRSGAAGNGGSGFAAPGGGTGGHSSNGGSVTVINHGNVSTTGNGAFGIYGLSVSGNGGTGGSQWGLVGSAGSGGFGGSGGPVSITNEETGTIATSGAFAHGILAQSIGGSGGSSGTSGNLILALQGSADNGGNGGTVTVVNRGLISTTGNFSRGIFAQSIGGGGGTGGTTGGLIALGGSGSNGGSAGTVTARNEETGEIFTTGIGSDGIFAHSVGGSGGSGSNAGGLVSVGGSGSKAGNGGVVTVENYGEISTMGAGARGIVAQSVGGGGGDGGNSGGLVSVGGSGSGGGTGALVTVKHGGVITTEGDGATAIFTQSVGGGGGNGGSAGSVSAFVGVAVGGSGGTGGAGGNVNVTLQGRNATTASVISTSGDRSSGLFAQSVGGGGGNGGGAVQVTGGYIGAVSIAVGGSGARGGAGGVVTVSPGTGGTAIIETGGADSAGVFLQSVGGGGGNGGYAVSVALAGGETVGASLAVGVGGTGGPGGTGGTVTVGSYDGIGAPTAGESGFNGTILTAGERSPGFIAQSVGGGGGNGGLSVTTAVGGGGAVGAAFTVGVGGSGGIGGIGGTVTVGFAGNVTTERASSAGMLVQSVGGGGGNGGGAVSVALSGGGVGGLSVGVAIGGNAGGGSIGGTVGFATLGGTVTTKGDHSTGITAQSIGGGGGTGGYTVAVAGAGAGTAAGAVSVGLGGSGGSGGHGGTVRTYLQSNVITSGDNSGGVLVQSVGGGGGNGGFNVTAGVAGAGVGAASLGFGMGGNGGAAGNGGLVETTSTGAIDTSGDNSAGFIAQSVGGGGGNGGFNVTANIAGGGTGAGSINGGLGGSGAGGGTGGVVTASTSGDVVTRGDSSTGILAQSVGGGGGNGGFNVSVALAFAGTGSGTGSVGLGGSGGGGGNASAVTLTVNNDVDTGLLDTDGSLISGDHSAGVVAQSIGGGGGNGGFNVTVSGTGAGTGSGALGIGVGGRGGGSGDGALVTSNVTGDITTRGDMAAGLLVQSVGGGGGNGGFNVTATIAGAGTGSGAVGLGFGGSGAGGGAGGEVSSTLTGDVMTVGDDSTGVIAQSLGGGGGNGAFNVTGTIAGAGTGSGAVGIGLGGSGGTGGVSNRVTNTVTGNVTTMGAGSGGVLAQSLGGGGGNGGFNVTGTISAAGTGTGAASVGIGGSGGSGGNSSIVTNTVDGDVSTFGAESYGILAQSVGGGGGNGGFNVSGTIAASGTGSFGASVGIGGSGGGGGSSGTDVNAVVVTNTVTGDVTTRGDKSTGVLAQSLGGGGGNGGFNVSAAVSAAGTGAGAVSVGIGGSGGGGGDSAGVTNSVTGDVSTGLVDASTGELASGHDSPGVIAQSIGGGGGNGGFNVNATIAAAGKGTGGVGVGIGGSGGGGGASGAITSTVTGDVTTRGDNSGGVLAQSVGGGGGNGGFNVDGTISASGTGAGAVSVGIGGSGGDGGMSGAVTNTVTGDVSTGLVDATTGALISGDDSPGVVAQSIGGGGGNGGFNVNGAITASGKGAGGVSVGIGGSGGAASDSSTVDNEVVGDVVTAGERSGGVLAQSLGGGGGSGGFSVNVAAGLAFSGESSGAGALSVGVGGSGGGGGNAARVTNEVTGDVVTWSADSFGILAQSVGGGGGNGGFNFSGAISAAGSGAGAVAVGVGGAGGAGGDAGIVENTVTGYVQTTGNDSAGITTQSLGGGGGNGALNISGTLTGSKSTSGGLAVGVGGLGADGGDGMSATSTVVGGVVTAGDRSAGILTQSLGGGGGKGGVNVTAAVNLSKENGGSLGVGVGGFGGGGGDAGSVTSTVTMTEEHPFVATFGADSPGISAQSIGGGGGNGGVNVTASVNLSGKSGAAIGVGVGGFGGGAGDAGALVKLDATGDVQTRGDNSDGITAQSIGGGGGNGGVNVTGTLAILKPSGGAAGTTVAASIGVGGFGGGGGQAFDVDVDYDGTIDAVPATKIVTPEVRITEIELPAGGTESVQDLFGVPYLLEAPAVENGSSGLVAQSIGGGGGNGAVNVSAGISYAAKEADGHALLVGVGGFGGAGGDAGTVTVDVTGQNSISAYGPGRSAILASSIGGGGGKGGVNVSGGITSDSPLIVGVGGLGGDGGTAGDVTVHAATDLHVSSVGYATNPAAAGLLAQSIGGGGGNGGLNVSGGLSLGKEANVPSVTFGIGGFGGAGATSGDVTVVQNGVIGTSGGWTHGILAQSLAGGGGNGALNVTGQINWADSQNSGGTKDLSIVAGLGGHGGLGADAGSVTVTSAGAIATSGDHARGILAQSIGGGGGTGGMNVTGIFAKNSSPISIGVGGFGSGGGNAGETVTVNRGTAENMTMIDTDGVGAHGIEASSIGGGGGSAGMNFIVGISLAGGSSGGGGGGGGGSTPRSHPKHTGVDDSVFANYDKVLDELEGKSKADSQDSTDANKGSAFAAQIAIGGGAGEGGEGGEVTVSHVGGIETQKDFSNGILAQSIGGGGGNATFNIALTYEGKSDKNKGFNVAIGGAPGDAGNGERVEVNHQGLIETHGKSSYGVLAQSIGGGGGNAGMDLAYSKTSGGKIGVTIGRVGGIGGSAGDVFLTSDGTVMTHGDTSYGLLAQSVGNGGGNSSSTSVSVGIPPADGAPERAGSIAVGLEGGMGGFAGDVTMNVSGWVSTDGKNSHAIFAQSIGGGGGNGGAATGVAYQASTAALTIGGTGGEGGTGGDVSVTSSAEVRTNNDRSVGILAQSIGGGGGTGGMARAGGTQNEGSGVLITIGGSGGKAMESGTVDVDNSGVVITDGEESHGVLAQSIGGGGGNAGMVLSIIRTKDASQSSQIGFSVGGSGGEGGISKDVTVTNTGGIGTAKAKSIGIFAQSIGGGGGNADKVITGAMSSSGAGNKFTMGIGGSGGTGAAAGNVNVFNLTGDDGTGGDIITLSNYSHGIMAMSVGGGGGTGSTTISANRSSAALGAESTSVAFGLGGAGGTGGTGGDVTVENGGSITTYGYKSHGIVAQSVGGGGGSGGWSIAGDLSAAVATSQTGSQINPTSNISIGGSGGDGNRAGDVTVTNTGSIEVSGDRSYGIYAQSVGGGGGDGGFAAALSRNVITNPRSNLGAQLLNFAVGGRAGAGGDGGDVIVNHTGSITSHGDNSYGIYAQSVGGGGGNVGYSVSSPAWMAADLAVTALLGGREGNTGTAGTVTVNTTGTVIMNGANSRAQFTQSVNGGGGNLELFLDVSQQAEAIAVGGVTLPPNPTDLDKVKAFVESKLGFGAEDVAGAVGSAIDATHAGDLVTLAENSVASIVQSIGGGGGTGDTEVVVDEQADVDLVAALGGKESADSGGGAIRQTRSGNVVTTGAMSQGGSIQSIGGGGGFSTVIVTRMPGDVSAVQAFGGGSARAEAPGTATAHATLGAEASTSNSGGDVVLEYDGVVSTSGDIAPGLVVQSIGAGGGQAVFTGLDSVTTTLGGSGFSTGNGGSIDLANSGDIVTTGDRADGIILQSIGGGGGLVLTDLDPSNVSVSTSADNLGSGGSIDFRQTGDIVVSGEGSAAVIAQTLGGGGGIVDRVFMDRAGGAGNSGSIDIDLDGNVVAEGEDGIGVFAQSRASGLEGDISVFLAEAKTLYFGASGTGVWISGGSDNTFENDGSVGGVDGMRAWGARGEEGNESVTNRGLYVGQFDLGAGTNSFTNVDGATFVAGPQLLLGASSNLLTQSGTMHLGDVAQRSLLTGSFAQTPTGETFGQIDFASPDPNIDGGLADQLLATGAVTLSGRLDIALLNTHLIPYGHFQKTIFGGDLGVTDAGMALTTAPSVVITYDLMYPTGFDAVLDYSVDFAPPELGRNLRRVGEYFNRIQAAGSSPELADVVAKLVADPDLDTYRQSLSQMSPDMYGSLQAHAMQGANRFADLLLGRGGYRALSGDDWFWFDVLDQSTVYEAYDDYKQTTHIENGVAMGMEKLLNDNWSAGFGFAVEIVDSRGFDSLWNADSNAQRLGAGIRRAAGATHFGTSFAYSHYGSDVTRSGAVTDPFEASISDRDLHVLSAIGSGSHRFDLDRFYVGLGLDLGVDYLIAEDGSESGADALNLQLQDYDETHVWTRPRLDVGYRAPLRSTLDLHVYGGVGLRYYLTDPYTDVVADLQGAPTGASAMVVPVPLGQSQVDTFLGLELMAGKTWSLGVQYNKGFSDHTDVDSFSFGFSARW